MLGVETNLAFAYSSCQNCYIELHDSLPIDFNHCPGFGLILILSMVKAMFFVDNVNTTLCDLSEAIKDM